ncbi:MAG: phosphoribosylglycinamide formyltransferase [Alphaproteobacteria bacterium]|jgi:phosphoribosylglycinamide formyltransferase-1
MPRLKLGVLISGRGSNMQALIDACRDPAYPAEIALVIANRADAGGLKRAAESGIATAMIPHRDYPDRQSFDAALDAALRDAGVELVCLAGFMRLLTASFVTSWHDRIVNIHPSLLPAFKGAHAHADVLAAGVKISGCTVHIVRPEMDDGPIIVQAAVPVLPGDTEDTLAARVLEAEHRCYPFAVRALAEGRVKVNGDNATVDAHTQPSALLISPHD